MKNKTQIKKHANGGTYYVVVPEPKATPVKKAEPVTTPLKGWNIPELKPNK